MAPKFTSSTVFYTSSFMNTAKPYIAKWYWFVAAFFISITVSWLFIKYTTPRYKVTSTILIPDDKQGNGILKATAFSDLNMFQVAKTVDNELEILRSKDLILPVLKKLNLEISYNKIKPFGNQELYGKKLPFWVLAVSLPGNAYTKALQLQGLTDSTFRLAEKKQSWVYKYGELIQYQGCQFIVNKGPAFANSHEAVDIRFNNLQRLAAAYSAGRLKVNPVIKESNTVVLTLEDPIPQRGMDILANLIDTYNVESVRKKNINAINTIAFIDKRLKAMSNDLSSAEGDIEAFQRQNNTIATAGEGTQLNLSKSAEYSQMLENSAVQLGVISSIERYLSGSANQFSVIPSTLGIKDPTLNTLIGRFNDLQIERARMLHSASITNPLVQNISDQLAGIRQNIKENLKNIKKGLLIEKSYQQRNSAVYQSKIQSVPAIEKGLLQRSREQSVKTSLYQYLLQKREETALSLSATIPTSQMVDSPAYDPEPAYPKAQLVYLFACIVGLLLPSTLIYLGQQFNAKVTDAKSLQLITGVPVLGELSHNDNIKSQVVIESGKHSTISELFRYIRSNLDASNLGIRNKVMLVTSCMKGEGKTFFSINLGLTLAMLNKRVLILEFDLRKPDLLKKLQMPQSKGISDFLQGNISALTDGIQSYGKAPNLYVMGCGTLPENPAEIIMNERMESLFAWLKERFDYLIVDTSPVGAVADAFSIAKYTDMSIYLVRYNYTYTHQLDILKDIRDNDKLKNPMVVFNDAKHQSRAAYGYGYAAEKSRV
jgi:tyrosine-protein kinase Etk/Wzc